MGYFLKYTSPRIMGCNSSTQKNIASPVSSTGKNSNITEEKEISVIKIKEVINLDTESKVLPACDNLNESVKLLRNNNSLMDLTKSESKKDLEEHTMEECHEIEEKFSTLEEVVERVVELYVSDKHNENEQVIQVVSDDKEKNIKDDENRNNTVKDEKSRKNEKSDIRQLRETNVISKEATSPSQSESSRATRWEALADIAAELPPSFAVDPVTGQIYTLSK